MSRMLFAATAMTALVFGIWRITTTANETAKAFDPPSKQTRRRALGPVSSVPRRLRKVFEPADDFKPIPKPGPSDWLANHEEPGQTVRQFRAAKPNRPDRKRHTIYLQPIGDFDPQRSPKLADLAAVTEASFGLNVKTLPPIPLKGLRLTTRINKETQKQQLLSTDVLGMLRKQLPRDAYCLLGITMTDLYPQESWNFVFGHASLRHRVGVYSFARYDPAFFGRKRTGDYKQVLLRRSCGVLVHETAHMFGMQHCIYYHCVVNGSNHLEESDAQPLHFCPVCLRKLHLSTRRDPIRRYRKLHKVYTRLKLKQEAEWVARRMKTLGEPLAKD